MIYGSSSNDERENIESILELRGSHISGKEKTLDYDFISLKEIIFLVKGRREKVLNKLPIIFNIK